MPVATARGTAARWAADRSIDHWIVAPDGLDPDGVAALARELASIAGDGGRIAIALRDGDAPAPLARVADHVAQVPTTGAAALSRFAWAGGAQDMRAVGMMAASPAWLEAAAAAGFGAIVAIDPGAGGRAALVWNQPDAIVRPDEVGALDAARWGSARAHRQRILLNPGPTVVTDRVHRAVGGPDLCHREPEYGALAGQVRARLLEVVDAPAGWEAVLIGGGGTSAMEAMVNGAVRPGRKLLVVRNGTYGDRLAAMADRAGIPHVDLHWPEVVPADPERIAAALDEDPAIDAVAVVHHETTTGLLNPIERIAAVCRARGRLTAVDAISSLGAEELDLGVGGIDLVAATANKCLHGLPGVSLVLLSPEGRERVRSAEPRTLYLDLALYLDAAARGSVPFTPPIPAVYGLLAALDELVDEGPAERRAFYRRRMASLDGMLGRLGLHILVAPEHRSSSIRAIALPDGVTYATVHDRLKERGFIIYAGMGPGAERQFRICVLGAIGLDALADLEPALAAAIGAA